MRATPNMGVPKWGRSFPDRSMDGKYRFRALPITEALADSNNFVCEFVGGSSANETGVGGGISGADLVLTQMGGIAAAVNGARTVAAAAGKGFTAPYGLIDPFARNAAGFSGLFRFRNISAAVGELFAWGYYGGKNAGGGGFSMFFYANEKQGSQVSASVINEAGDVMSAGVPYGNGPVVIPPNTDLSLLISFDYTTRLTFWGIGLGDKQPVDLSGFTAFSLMPPMTTGFTPPAAAFTGYSPYDSQATWGTSNCIVGTPNAPSVKSFGMDIKSVSFAKYPAVVPA
jgi:hypothetical protein